MNEDRSAPQESAPENGGVVRRQLADLKASLFSPVDAASLGAFRMMFGIVLLWEVTRYFRYGWIEEYYVSPPLHFKYLFFEWVQRWPGTGMFWHFGALGVLAALIAVGLFYRPAAILFFLGFSYVFLLDQGRYLNHFYLICLVSFLLVCAGGNRWMSLDRLLFLRGTPETVPLWQLQLVRAQMFIVYFYGGVAKLNGDWLRGEPVRAWLRERAEEAPAALGSLLSKDWMPWFIAYGGLVFDLGIGFLLVWRRTRAFGMVLALAFHTTNNFLFHIGIFPYLAMALTLLFFDPDWPRRLLRRIGVREPMSTPVVTAPPRPGRARDGWVIAFISLYVLVQLVVPLRHWLYPGDVAWTEEGHRFAWRMKLRDKESQIAVLVVDPHTGREWDEDPNSYLPPWQMDEMMGRPDMVLQFAQFLRDRHRTRGVSDPQVYASVLCSLNGAPERELIDPDVNLAAEKRSLGPARWILGRKSR